MHIKVNDDKIGPGVELRDPARLELLKELHDILGPLPQRAQASLLLCDLECLQSLSEYLQRTSETAKHPMPLATMRRGLSASLVDEIVATWCRLSRPCSAASPTRSILPSRGHLKSSPLRHVNVAKPEAQVPEEQEETESLARPSKRRRMDSQSPISYSGGESISRFVSDECKNRDAYRCVITKLAGPIDAAHLIPFSLNRKDRRAAFFSLIKDLWSERIGKWKRLLDNGTEFVANMLSLTPTLHRYHSEGLFGLQPIEASLDGRSLRLKFYWLPQRETPSSTITDLTSIPALPDDVELEDIKICNAKDGHLIKSGEVIELTTSDPEQRPLPNWELLEMQWVMQRLMVLRGAADLPDSVFEESEDSASFGNYEMEADQILEKEATEGCQSDRINDWIDTQRIQSQVI